MSDDEIVEEWLSSIDDSLYSLYFFKYEGDFNKAYIIEFLSK